MNKIRSLAASLMIICLIAALVPIEASAADGQSASNGYSDIAGTWAESVIGEYGHSDIFDSGDGLFAPDKAITRLEFARLLHEALGINICYFAATDIGDYFADVTKDDEGESELYDLVTCGIIDVTGSFHPYETLSREEMIHFAMNAYSYVMGGSFVLPMIAREPYTDDGEIDAEYKTDIYYAAVLGLVNGRGDGSVSPKTAATRAEAVALAARIAARHELTLSGVEVSDSAKELNGELVMTLSIINNSESSVTIDCSSGQRYDFTVLDANGKELYRWSDGKAFNMMVSSVKIEPHGTVSYSDSLDSQELDSLRSKIAAVKAYISGKSSDFTIDENGYTAVLSFNQTLD